jgi:hypothetical protein
VVKRKKTKNPVSAVQLYTFWMNSGLFNEMHLRRERMVTHMNTQKYPVEERIGGWVIEPVLHPDGRVTLFKFDQQIGIYSRDDDDDDDACAMGFC